MNIQPERSAPSSRATMSGQLALVAWALSPAGAAYLKNLPAFQVLLGIFLAGCIASSITNTVKKNWKDILNRPKYLVLAGIFGIIPNDIFYIFAFKYAPALQVDLIVCMWPMFVMILAAIFLREEIGIVHIFACLIAFCGCYIAIYSNIKIEQFQFEYIFGYICAFMSAFLWAIYAVISKKYAEPTPELFAFYCGVGTMFSAIMHFTFETTVIPSIQEIFVLFAMGVITHSLAYYMWDFAIQKGHFNLLGIMPYGNIILSVLALAAFGFAELTPDILVATLMIFAAGLLIKYHDTTKKKKA